MVISVDEGGERITINPVAMTTTVMGNAGLCESCRIDFYLDDFDGMPDANQEALAWIGTSTELSDDL